MNQRIHHYIVLMGIAWRLETQTTSRCMTPGVLDSSSEARESEVSKVAAVQYQEVARSGSGGQDDVATWSKTGAAHVVHDAHAGLQISCHGKARSVPLREAEIWEDASCRARQRETSEVVRQVVFGVDAAVGCNPVPAPPTTRFTARTSAWRSAPSGHQNQTCRGSNDEARHCHPCEP